MSKSTNRMSIFSSKSLPFKINSGTSGALQTHSLWQNTIKYDPYAPLPEEKKEGENLLWSMPKKKQVILWISHRVHSILSRKTQRRARNAIKVRKFKLLFFYHKRKFSNLVGHLIYQCLNNITLKKTLANVILKIKLFVN